MSKDNYENKTFQYNYPYTWEKRNRPYLKLREDRTPNKDFIVPLVFRLRFYYKGVLMEDQFFTSVKNKLPFPVMALAGVWKFEYNNEEVSVTSDDYSLLIDAINDGYEDIKLTYEVA